MRWFVSWVLWTLVMWVAFNQLLCGRTQGTSEKEIVEDCPWFITQAFDARQLHRS
jgi:hypothetical protein